MKNRDVCPFTLRESLIRRIRYTSGRGFLGESGKSIHPNEDQGLEENNFIFIAFRFRTDLIELIESNRKHGLSRFEDLAKKDRTKVV